MQSLSLHPHNTTRTTVARFTKHHHHRNASYTQRAPPRPTKEADIRTWLLRFWWFVRVCACVFVRLCVFGAFVRVRACVYLWNYVHTAGS